MPNLRDEVETSLERIRNSLRVDGGDVELVEIDDGMVKLRLKGSCAGCPFSQITLKNFIERELKREVSGVKGVVSVE
jgi:Fe-S cluster biogenesis protein NfuA